MLLLFSASEEGILEAVVGFINSGDILQQMKDPYEMYELKGKRQQDFQIGSYCKDQSSVGQN